VLHAVSPIPVPALMGATRDVAAILAPRADELRADLVSAVQQNGIDLSTADLVVDHGEPVPCILRHAAMSQNTMIVMGTHGRSGFDRFALGSVTEKVLRKATCPVLTVPPTSVAKSSLPFKRLLCPVDFSAPSLTAFEHALAIARESDAHLTLLHVLDWASLSETDALAEVAPGAYAFRRYLDEQAQRQLERLKPEGGTEYCELALVVRYGRAHEGIIDTAAAERSDLIVMGVHGRNAFGLALFGSTTNQVVRHAVCPVLTLRH
jgi:nucleotide-binding universal stress UspA family protein